MDEPIADPSAVELRGGPLDGGRILVAIPTPRMIVGVHEMASGIPRRHWYKMTDRTTPDALPIFDYVGSTDKDIG